MPALAFYLTFVLGPVLVNFVSALFRWTGTRLVGFAGLDNFAAVFSGVNGRQLVPALLHNVIIFVATLAIYLTIAMLLAALIHTTRWGKRLFQTIYSLPYLLSPLIVGYLWTLLLSPLFGPINQLLRDLGLGVFAQPWLVQPSTALLSVILIGAWQGIGVPVLMIGAALGSIPAEIEEAAALDGAGMWRTFFQIRIPQITETLRVVVVLTFIGGFNVLELVFALGGGSSGGAGGSIDTVGLLFYRSAFKGGLNAIGESSAIAALIFLMTFIGALLAERLLGGRREAKS